MPNSQSLSFSADAIVDTVREPMLVLSADLRVRRANRSFYRTFKVTPEETVDRLVYDLGNQQWDIPWLRKLIITHLSCVEKALCSGCKSLMQNGFRRIAGCSNIVPALDKNCQFCPRFSRDCFTVTRRSPFTLPPIETKSHNEQKLDNNGSRTGKTWGNEAEELSAFVGQTDRKPRVPSPALSNRCTKLSEQCVSFRRCSHLH